MVAGARRLEWWTAASLSLLCTYLWISLVYEGSLAVFAVRTRYSVPILLLLLTLTCGGVRRLAARGTLSPARQKETITLALSVLFSLLAADILYGAYSSITNPSEGEPFEYERMSDANVWHGELFPRSYFPTSANFRVYKPNVRLSAVTYGEFYDPSMLDSPTVVESVLERRPLTYSIDENGFRNRFSVAEAGVFALGDSFALGATTDEGSTWTDHLSVLIDAPIYNLGISSSGPGVQLPLLEDLIRSRPETVNVTHLLWMIYEGNDLENAYAELRPPRFPSPTVGGLVRGLTVGPVVGLIRGIKERSVIGKIARGELQLRRLPAAADSPFIVDGVRLRYPLYESERWGLRFFNPIDIERAAMNASYVDAHPNRPALDRTFERMKALSEEFGFRVTVLIAPSAARMYADGFEGFPSISSTPHFIDYVEDLSSRTGFEVVDLLPLMAPYAKTELLFYRDDHHWNLRGNEVAAEVISARVAF